MPRPSRRTVLATGSAVGGVLMAGGLPAQASAASREAAEVTTPGDPWRTVLDDADLVWQKLPKTWYEGPYLGNGFLGSGIYAEPSPQPDGGTTALRFNVQHSEVQDLPQALKEQGVPPSRVRLPLRPRAPADRPLHPRTRRQDHRHRLAPAAARRRTDGHPHHGQGHPEAPRADPHHTLGPRRRGHAERGRARFPVGVPPGGGDQPARRVQAAAGGVRGQPPTEVKEPDGYAPRSIRHSKLHTLSRVNYVVARAGPVQHSSRPPGGWSWDRARHVKLPGEIQGRHLALAAQENSNGSSSTTNSWPQQSAAAPSRGAGRTLAGRPSPTRGGT